MYYVIAVFYRNGRVEHVAFARVAAGSIELAVERFAAAVRLPMSSMTVASLGGSTEGPVAANFENRCLIQVGRAGRRRQRKQPSEVEG